MRTRPFKKGELLRVTSGKFRGWRGTRWECENDRGVRYYSLHARYRQTIKGRVDAETVGLGVILNIPEEHLTVALR